MKKTPPLPSKCSPAHPVIVALIAKKITRRKAYSVLTLLFSLHGMRLAKAKELATEVIVRYS